jgi:hypothetical protein
LKIYSPVVLRSEAEPLVGQELIKVLINFKQLAAAPSPPKLNNPIRSEGF